MRFPFVRQPDSRLCGPACLASIAAFFGKRYSARFISSRCGIHPEGTSLLSLARTARWLGFETMCVALRYQDLFLVDTPCILHWNQNHFVVLYKVDTKRDVYYVSDPAKGKVRLSKEELLIHWIGNADRGHALMLEPTSSFGEVKETQSDIHSAMSIIRRHLKSYRGYLIQLGLGMLFASSIQFVFPFLTQMIVDVAIRGREVSLLGFILAGWLLIIFARMMTDVIRNWLMLHMTLRVNVSLISDFFIKLMGLPMAFFDSRTIGDLTQRVHDHNRVQSFLTSRLLDTVFSLVSFLVFAVILAGYDVCIFMVFCIGSILYVAWILSFLRKRKVLDYEVFEVEAINQSKSYQMLASMQEIKIQGCRTRRRWEWEDIQSDLFLVRQKMLRLQQIEESGAAMITEIKNIVITIMAAMLVMDGGISIGAMMAILYIIGQLNSPLRQMVDSVYAFQDMKISLERISEVHSADMESVGRGSQKAMVSAEIDLRNVCFKYDRDAPVYTVKDISFKVEEGRTTAIVGFSGCGKTTLIKLILGYYQDMEGEILVSGRNIKEYDVDWLRSCFGVVMQDGFIFTESIARNIAVGDEEIDWERLLTAAHIANIGDFIDSLPLGFNIVIGQEGTGLSKGQRQRILIARAVYKDPKILILDEATNALDATNERIIVENLMSYCKGKTVLVIAHRLSTVRNADRIVVMDRGSIVESGRHEELIRIKGQYYQLVKNQLELAE